MSDAKPAPLTRRHFLAGSAALGAAVMLHPYSARAAANQAHLRLMETTDIHVNVYPYDYYADKAERHGGPGPHRLDRRARSAPRPSNAMLFDNGDFLQGNPMGDYIAYERGMKDGDIHPVIKAMNVLDYDCRHARQSRVQLRPDFMFRRFWPGRIFPIVCANLTKGKLAADAASGRRSSSSPISSSNARSNDGDGRRSPIKIGVIGFVPPQIMIWDRKNLEGKAADPRHRRGGQGLGAEACGRKAPTSSSPCRIPASPATAAGRRAWKTPRSISPASRASTRSSPATSICVFPGQKDFPGHRGRRPGERHARRQAGRHGRLLGLRISASIDLLLEHDGKALEDRRLHHRGCGRSTSATKTKVVADGRERRAQVLAAAKTEHEATLAYVRTPVGKTSAPLYSYFALVADDPSVQIVIQAQTWYIARNAEGDGIRGPAAAFGGRALQGGRTRWPGLLHRRRRRRRSRSRTSPTSISIPTPCGR